MRRPSTIALLVLAVAGLYLVLHPYLGITHDARLYTLQALNHLHPELYGNDVFLRYGSQDDYTLFTPLYAWMISWLGVEPAASLLTLISHVSFLTAAVLISRSLLSGSTVWAAIALLLLLPDHYGPSRIFSYMEEFVTPRQLAESLVLFGLVCWLRERRILAAVFLALAMMSHPIMGLAGIAVVAGMFFVLPHWRKLWPFAMLLLLGVAVVALTGLIPSSWKLDDEWLGIVLARAEYLHLGNWTSDDWGRVATVAATLAIATRLLTGNLQRVAVATLLSASTLTLLSLIGGDLLHVTLIVQAQPWRVLWLATVIAVIALPALAQAGWNAGGLRRCSVLLLAGAWLSPSEDLALLMAPLAVTAGILGEIRLDDKHVRKLLLGAYFVPALILVHALAVSMLSLKAGTFNVSVSPVLDSLRNSSAGGTVPLLLLFAGWWIVRAAPKVMLPALAAALALPVAAAAERTADTWRETSFDEKLKAAFSEWRQLIPPGSDVMWTTDQSMGADSTTSVWLLLERPSFVSRIQATTSLFSRDAALEMRRRTASILGLLPDIQSLYPPDVEPTEPDPLLLAPVCRTSQVRYIVTFADFVDATPIDAPANVRAPFRNLKLYICP